MSDMDAPYAQRKQPRQHSSTSSVSNLHHYKNNCLFGEENTELLQCVSCLSLAKSFATFDVNKLLRMTEFYPNDFIDVSKVALHHQLKNYVVNV